MAVSEPPFPAMAPEGVEELTEAQMEQQAALKQASTEAQEEGKLELALKTLTDAICVGAPSAMMYSRRAQLLMQLERPIAAVNDCTAALVVNPDSAKAFKIRARANVQLEKWVEANADFSQGLNIDYDEDTEEASKEASAKAKELNIATVTKRNRDEADQYHRTLQANKEAYEAGLKAREGDWKAAKDKEEAEKRNAEEERKKRFRKNQEASEEGAPKSHGPPGSAEEQTTETEEGAPKSHGPPGGSGEAEAVD